MQNQIAKVEVSQTSPSSRVKQQSNEQPIQEEKISKISKIDTKDDDVKIKIEDMQQSLIKYEKSQAKEENLGLTQQQDTPIISQNDGRVLTNSKQGHTSKKGKRKILQIQKLEDVRLIAADFLENGLNFRKFNKLHPQVDGKFYRNTVQAVNNTAINEIQKFLRYECNIQIEKLNRDQKRSIRTQLTQVRFWLAKRDMAQLETFYKFIQRRYQLVDVDISIEQALKLYKTILQIVKSPYVDVLQDDIKPQILDPQTAAKASQHDRQMKQKTLILLFLRHKNLTKVADCLCQKFGYSLSWSKHGVKQKIKYLLKNSLKKLIGSVEAYQKSIQLFFSQTQECVNLLMSSQHSLNIRLLLLSFYLQKTVTLIQLRQFVKSVNKFFIQQYKNHGQYQCKKFEQDVKLPKLEKKQNDQGDHCEQEQQKYQNEQIKIIVEQIPQDIKQVKKIKQDDQVKIEREILKIQKEEQKKNLNQAKKETNKQDNQMIETQDLVVTFDVMLKKQNL